MTEQTEREVLEALWDRVDMRGYAIRARFTAMLDAGAYLSAAEMLVPETSDGPRWSVDTDNTDLANKCSGSGARVITYADGFSVFDGYGPTPALALCAAVEAALSGGERGNS